MPSNVRSVVPTPAQLEILELVAEGLTDEAIGKRLGKSRETIRTHMNHMMARMHVHTRAAAVAVALRQGWFE